MAAPSDKYQLIASLGRGGMADVYLAAMRGPVGFHKLVVIKRLRDDVADQASFTTMLLEEAQLAARLQHPNVVQTFEVGVHEGRHYIVMEYLEGQPIARVLKVGGRPDPALSARVMGEALAGLEYAHTLADYDGRPLSIIHRDVSPQNLFITYEGEVKVVDFGVAKTNLHVGDATEAGVIKGKLGYMAPEQLKGGAIDRRTDVFAAGIVFWEMLTGRRLFARTGDDGPTQAIAKILFQEIPRPREFEPDIPPALDAVCMRALEREADDRWQSAAEMREALYAQRDASGRAFRRDDVGKYVLSLFEQERAEVRGRITEYMAEAANRPLSRDTGSLRALHSPPSPSVSAAGTGQVSAAGGSTGAPGSTRDAETVVAGRTGPSRSVDVELPHDRTRALPHGAKLAAEPARGLMPSIPPGASPSPSMPPSSLPSSAVPSHVPPPPSRAVAPRPGWLFPAIAAGGLAFLALAIVVLVLTLRKPARLTGDGGVSSTSSGQGGAVLAAPVLTLEGSGTIGVEVAPLLIESFLKKRGATAVQREKGARPSDIRVIATTPRGPEVILVRNEGTNGGFQCLAERACDIAMAAREIHEAEATQLIDKGVGDLRSPASEHVIALDGIAVLVNRANEIRSLDRAQIDGVFTGQITDWSAVGGAPGPISIVAHENGSGTLDAFDAMVLGGHALASTARRMPDNAAIADAVAVDQNATGFVGLAFVRGAKAIAIADRGVAPMFPSAFTITTEKYLLSRRFYFYTPAPPKPAALDFVDHVLSEAGQKIIRDGGFIDLELSLKNAEPCDRCPARYAAATKHARRLSLDFRFRPGSRLLDARAVRDVDRVVRFLRDHSSAKVALYGFSDKSPDAKADHRRAKELAQAVNAELGARGLRAGTVEGFGSDMPVATNATDWGRTKNRRVEVWIEEDR